MTIGESVRELNLQLLKTRMAFRQTLQKLLKLHHFDITFEMLQIMSCLWARQGVSQQYLAEKTAKDKACLTHLVNNLEKRGWVVRQKDNADQRNRLIFLTPEGEALSGRIKPLINSIYDHIGQKMGDTAIQSCLDHLKQFEEGLNEI